MRTANAGQARTLRRLLARIHLERLVAPQLDLPGRRANLELAAAFGDVAARITESNVEAIWRLTEAMTEIGDRAQRFRQPREPPDRVRVQSGELPALTCGIRHRQHRRPPQIRVDGSAVAVCAAVAVIAVVAVGGGVLGSRGVGHVRHNTRRLGAAR